jgi:hypothetical protein
VAAHAARDPRAAGNRRLKRGGPASPGRAPRGEVRGVRGGHPAEEPHHRSVATAEVLRDRDAVALQPGPRRVGLRPHRAVCPPTEDVLAVLGGRHPRHHDASRSRGLTDPHARFSPTFQRRPRERSTNGNRSTRLAKAPCVKRELRVIASAHARAEMRRLSAKRSAPSPRLRRSRLTSSATARRWRLRSMALIGRSKSLTDAHNRKPKRQVRVAGAPYEAEAAAVTHGGTRSSSARARSVPGVGRGARRLSLAPCNPTAIGMAGGVAA